jgi:hypothetical protein
MTASAGLPESAAASMASPTPPRGARRRALAVFVLSGASLWMVACGAEAPTSDAASAAGPGTASAAGDTCLTETSLEDFMAGLLTDTDASTSPGDVLLLAGPQIDQSNETVTANGFGFTVTSWAAQTFVPASSGPLTRIDLSLFCSGCTGSTPDLVVSIRATAGSPAVPTGPDLATATIPGFSSGSGGYFSAVFGSPYTVAAGTSYALVLRATANPSAGVYAYVCSCTTNTNPYSAGQRATSSNSGATWTADTTAGGRDLGFKVYVDSGYWPSGTFISSRKDANPGADEEVHWSSLGWSASAPAGTTLQVQAAGSSDPAGPFDYVGPDGTSGTFFASGASLAQFNGKRYLQYQVAFGTSDPALSPVLQDVTTCFQNVPTAVATTLAVSPSDGTYGGTASLSATLTASAVGLSGRTVSFTLGGTPVGSATTDGSGTATLAGVSLAGFTAGTSSGAVGASYAGEAGYLASSGSNDLTITRATQTITFAALADRVMTDGGFTVSATGGGSGNPVTFSTGSAACSVTGTTVTPISAGTCAIDADQAGNTDYAAAATVSRSFTITRAAQTITFAALADRVMTDGGFTVSATGGGSGNPVTFSTGSAACSVTGTTVTPISAGTCAIDADQAGNTDYAAAARVSRSFTITLATQTVTFPEVAALSPGDLIELQATASSGLAVSYLVLSGPCSVSGDTLTASEAGTCEVAADQAGDSSYLAAPRATIFVTINRPGGGGGGGGCSTGSDASPRALVLLTMTALTWRRRRRPVSLVARRT